jgi:O-methyltransferase
MLRIFQKAFNAFGFELVKTRHLNSMVGLEASFIDLYNQCKPFTMTSIERMYALYKSIEYICLNKIEGDIVECGVWKGGSSMLAAGALRQFNNTFKSIYLFDTFEGMPEPGKYDRNFNNAEASIEYEKSLLERGHSSWCYSSLEEVKANMQRTEYPEMNINFIKGKVEDTIPGSIPQKIALLRLDTDWYESTYHELKHLFPLLSKGGILILDDYGHWQGARKATDEYFAGLSIFPFLSRIDYTGRIYIKP